jgi:superfamily II RNA helicase
MGKNTTDFEKLKPPGLKVPMTKEQLQELVKCHKDPLWFMEHFMYIQHPTKGKVPFEAYLFQRDLVHAYDEYRNVLAMIPRQSGKCVVHDTLISIKQQSTGEIYDIPIGTYYEWAACMRAGTTLPDISQYKRRDTVSTARRR